VIVSNNKILFFFKKAQQLSIENHKKNHQEGRKSSDPKKLFRG
jgi:hypothetical protein